MGSAVVISASAVVISAVDNMQSVDVVKVMHRYLKETLDSEDWTSEDVSSVLIQRPRLQETTIVVI